MQMRPLLMMCVAVLIVTRTMNSNDKKDKERVLGSWQATAIDYDGQSEDEQLVNSTRVTIDDKKFHMIGDGLDSEAVYQMDPATRPKVFNLIVEEPGQRPQGMRGIYSLKNDELRICYSRPGAPRPKKFESATNSRHTLLVLKRVKE